MWLKTVETPQTCDKLSTNSNSLLTLSALFDPLAVHSKSIYLIYITLFNQVFKYILTFQIQISIILTSYEEEEVRDV